MMISRPLLDKLAISLSLICTVQCLTMPLLVVLLPATAALPVDEEMFHLILLYFVVPVSALALLMGCQQHRNTTVVLFGGLGLIVLIATGTIGHDLLSETGERIWTVVGSLLIALGHVRNHQLCRHQACECKSDPASELA